MTTINAYLNFNGNCEEAFNFYASIFGDETPTFDRFADTPNAEDLPDSEKHKIMHASLPVGQDNVLLGMACITNRKILRERRSWQSI